MVFFSCKSLCLYHSVSPEHLLYSTNNKYCFREFSITSMTGGYRRVFQKPIDFEWYAMCIVRASSSFEVKHYMEVKTNFVCKLLQGITDLH